MYIMFHRFGPKPKSPVLRAFANKAFRWSQERFSGLPMCNLKDLIVEIHFKGVR